MTAAIVVEMTAQEAKYLEAIRRATSELGQMEGAMDKVAKKGREAAQEEASMARAGAQVWEETRTPLERHLVKMGELEKLFEKGHVDIETYRRKVHDLGEEFNKTGTAARDAFGHETAETLRNFATSMISIGGAAAVFKSMINKVHELKTEAAAAGSSAEMSEGALAEVAGGNAEKMRSLLNISRGMAAQHGMSREQAAGLTFQLASADALDQADLIGNLYGRGIVKDPAVLARAGKTMVSAMGKEETGGMRAEISKGFAAGEFAPAYTAELMPAAAKAATFAKAAGVSDTELLAGTAIVSEATGGADAAGTGMKALMKSLGRIGAAKEGSGYTQAEYDADKLAIEADKRDAQEWLHEAARSDPQYLKQVRGIEIEKAKLQSRELPHMMPEIRADAAMRRKALAENEREALRASESRAEHGEAWQRTSLDLKHREEVLAKKRTGIGSGIESDDEGLILDEETKAVRARIGTALRATKGQGLQAQLDAIAKENFDEAQLQKLFGRQEGLNAFRIIQQNRGRYGQAVQRIGEAEKQDLAGHMLTLTDDPELSSARSARIQKSLAADAARPLATITQLFQATKDHYKKRVLEGSISTVLPAEWDIAATAAAETATGWMPGHEKRMLRQGLKQGVLDDEPQLKSQVQEALGMKEALERNTAVLERIEANTKRATEGNPTLGHTDRDR